MTQIIFNNKNSYINFGLVIESVDIQSPSKKKNKDSVVGMNGSYDFSTIASGGEIVYNERQIKIKFNLVMDSKTDLYTKYSEVLEWLEGVGQSQLLFDFIPDFYFLAECEDVPTFEEVLQLAGKLEVSFTCDPFKYGVDYVQGTNFDIVNSETITIYNPSNHSIVPYVVTNNEMICSLNGYTSIFNINTHMDWDFKLSPGNNVIVIIGTGNIDFQFRNKGL